MTDPTPPVLQIRDLTIGLKAGPALVRDLTLEIAAGETLCVVGESGSGKSLTSLAVMGLLDREALEIRGGTIGVAGEDVLAATPKRLREMRGGVMSMVFQEPMTALNPVEPVGAQVEEVLRLHGERNAARRRARVLEMLAEVHLPEPERIYRSYSHELSGGQRQRVVICMALVMRPRLLIADEPTTALDVTTQKQILALIDELKARTGTAVLFITHDFGVVSEIADRICVMNRGDVVETGTRDQVLSAPRHDYTRMLVASVPGLVPPPARAVGRDVALKVDALAKTYGARGMFGRGRRVQALRPSGFALHRGEIVGIVGESGSGKTTMARCLSRLIQPTAGRIELEGRDISGLRERALRESRRNLQVVFQDPFRSLNARMKVRDLICEGMINYAVPRASAHARAGALLERVGLGRDALDRYPHQFSGGQRQRICIARALALDPSVLIADEAVSALDVSVQRQVLDLLASLRDERDIAILFITHDLRVAAQICDRILVMKAGEVVEQGPAARVLTAPDHPYTRDLLAAAPGRDWDFANFRPQRATAAPAHG
ncbi:ABC transporter ATP-binding protein [Frigidibacter sp. MR17.24]|uniref:ABC transporter ATP-binding protein n=1 Tax=Frigidibacter sp. MR17.24 TaxID=3127345 RepID=UPI003012DE45